MNQETTQLTTTNNNTGFDITAFGGFSPMDLIPSNVVLVQGKNDLKKKIKTLQDGDIVIDSNVIKQPIEFIFVKSEALFDVYEGGTITADYKLKDDATFIKSIRYDIEPAGLTQVDPNAKFPVLFTADDLRFYEKKMIFLVAINGLPCKIVFKSAPKHFNAKTLYNNIVKGAKLNGFNEPIHAVFNLFAFEKEGRQGAFWLFDCNYSRAATEEELATAYQISGIDLIKSTTNIDPEAPF